MAAGKGPEAFAAPRETAMGLGGAGRVHREKLANGVLRATA